jgi:uncharacterized YigZ family protein
MEFLILKEEKFEYEEKKSIFIAKVKRINTEEEAKSFICKVASENKGASHNVYAYIVDEGKTQRYNEDGEPQGTAAMPILEVLKKKHITDVVLVVTRYFGGTLLGTGGLVRSYSKSALGVIEKAGMGIKTIGYNFSFKFDYSNLGKIKYFLEKRDILIDTLEYGEKINISFLTKEEDKNPVINYLNEIVLGELNLKVEALPCLLENKNLIKL